MPRKPKDYSVLLTEQFTDAQIKNMIPKLSKVANERLKNLESHGINIWAYRSAEKFFEKENREKNRFSGSKNSKTLRREFNAIAEFLNYRTSTISGMDDVKYERLQNIEENLGMKIEDPKTFWDFLKSSEYKSLRKRIGSDQAMQDFAEAMTEKNFSADEIKEAYRDFLSSDEMTFEQIAERRKQSKNLR